MINKLLDFYIACKACKVECKETNEGILCVKCGAYISDEQLDEIIGYGS